MWVRGKENQMETIKIALNVEKTDALAAGCTKYGSYVYEVTKEVLGLLNDKERVFLAEASPPGFLLPEEADGAISSLTVPPEATDNQIATRIIARYKTVAVSRAKKKAEIDAATTRILAMSYAELVEAEALRCSPESMTYWSQCKDAELARKSEAGREALMKAYKLQEKIRDEERKADLVNRISDIPLDKLWDKHLNTQNDSFAVCSVSDFWCVRDVPEVQQRCEQAYRWYLEQQAAAKAQVEADKACYEAYIREHCSQTQRERFEAGRLDKKEVLAQVIEEMMPSTEAFRAWEGIQSEDIPHLDPEDPNGYCDGPKIKFSAENHDGVLSDVEWEHLKQITDAAKARCKDASVKVRMHSGWCAQDNCPGPAVQRMGILVTVRWAGEKLQREYAMPE